MADSAAPRWAVRVGAVSAALALGWLWHCRAAERREREQQEAARASGAAAAGSGGQGQSPQARAAAAGGDSDGQGEEAAVACVTASAPGKVLLTGGYLVLDRAFTGLVLSLNARFHSRVSPLRRAERAAIAQRWPAAAEGGWARAAAVVLSAPQRMAEPAIYRLSLEALTLTQLAGAERNRYAELAIVYTLRALSERAATRGRAEAFAATLASGLHVRVHGDSQFYTAEQPPAGAGAGAEAPQLLERRDGKTGLGSSAALVSSLVAALCASFGGGEAESKEASELAHKLAQFAHCAAQGKVGSGFDVAAAFFGSQRYRRFSPQLLAPLLALHDAGKASSQSVLSALSAPWDNEAVPFALPPGLHLVLGDVRGGSETPAMVKRVLEWREARADEAEALWRALDADNREVERLLSELGAEAARDSRGYERSLAALAALASDAWPAAAEAGRVGAIVSQLRATFARVRAGLRAMGEGAGVPIEPPQQTRLLDHTMALPGVVLAGVPGAGGVDAVFALALSDEAARGVEAAWARYAESTVRRLPVAEARGGVRVERGARVDRVL